MVKINGEKLDVAGKTIAEYLATTKYDPKRIAVERNGDIVPKAQYPDTVLEDGDSVEVVSFVGGGNLIPTKEAWDVALKERHGEELQEKFSAATVAICGLGGLGSNIAVSLARAGIGKLILIDFDHVDISNLHRQQYKADQIGIYKTEALCENLKEVAPYVVIETHTVRITEDSAVELLKDADIICEAFDGAEAKAMLTNLVLEVMPKKYLVAASGMAGLGSANTIKTRKVTNKFYLCGDEVSDVKDGIGLVSSRVMLCAAHQAHIVLRILAEEYEV